MSDVAGGPVPARDAVPEPAAGRPAAAGALDDDALDDGADWAARVGDAVAATDAGQLDLSGIVIDTSVPHPARRYDYLLGGKTNYAPDRASADAATAAFPALRTTILENRRFLRRAVTYMARDDGVDQFLDIGTGIPSPGNTHEVSQAINPASRVVYVDNDPVVLVHSRALLSDTPQGRTAFIPADLRDPETILSHPALAATLDLSRPVGLLLIAVVHFIEDDDEANGVVRRLVEALPSGSYLALSNATYDVLPPEVAARLTEAMTADRPSAAWARTRPQVERFFDGLELVPPGVVTLNRWRADDEPPPRPRDDETVVYGGLARIP